MALGKINKDFEISELLEKYCNKILVSSNLVDFHDTLLVVGSSVGGMRRELRKIYFLKQVVTKRLIQNSTISTLLLIY